MVWNWRDWRNDLIANPRFQSWAARFPLTRLIAARRARKAFDLAAGFVYSQILLACVQTRLLEALRAGPRLLDDLASALCLPLDGAERLLLGAVALGLAEKRGPGRFGLGPHGAAFLGNPGALAMVEHHRLVYADLADPVGLLRGGAARSNLSRFWAYASADGSSPIDADRVRDYSVLMAQSQELVRSDILDAYPLGGARLLMDVGGGEGVFVSEAARLWPELRAVCVDLPAVAERATRKFATLGLSARVAACGANFHAEPLPQGADVVSLIRVLHDHDDTQAQALLASIRASLAPGGVLLVAEPMAEARGAEAMGDAYFGFYLLAMGSGRPRSRQRISDMLRTAGFTNVRALKTARPMLVDVIVAK